MTDTPTAEPTPAPAVDVAAVRAALASYDDAVADWQVANDEQDDAPDVRDAEHYSERLEELAHHMAGLLADLVPDHAAPVTVETSNSYACGRESGERFQTAAPEPGADLDEWWQSDAIRSHIGDGHPCGSSEHALYEARIVAAPGRLDLIGAEWSGEG